MDELRAEVAEVDAILRGLGVRGRLAPLDPPIRPPRRSTRRREDVPDLPRLPIANRTIGQVYAGRYRPSTFATFTLDNYGRVDAESVPIDMDTYDYRRAARDAIHFPAVLDRLIQNLRRAVGMELQYFGTVEPQRRLAPHFHAAIRGSIPRALMKQVAAASYRQIWWPLHDEMTYPDQNVPVWDDHHRAFVDPDTRQPLPSWVEATDPAVLTTPGHVVRLGPQVHVKGVLGGTPDAGKHIGYLAKYITKSITATVGLDEDASARKREHARRLHTELSRTPCSDRCPIWLRYGVEPKGAGSKTVPGRCKGKAHRPEYLGMGGRRVLVSRKWSGKTLDDHRDERGAVCSATARRGRHHRQPRLQARAGDVGEAVPARSRRPAPAGAAHARHRRTTTLESRVRRRTARRAGATTRLVRNEGGGSVTATTERTDSARADNLWSVQRLAEYLGVPVQTVYQWRTKRYGPRGLRVGKHIRYRPADVERWLASLTDDLI
jgi:excisionase family DNA binding protein